MDKTNALSLTGGGMFDGGWTPVWLIKDEFTGTVAAGSVDGTAATPGPGTRTVTDADSSLSVGSGAASLAAGDGIWYEQLSAQSGLLVVVRLATTTGPTYVGWDNNQSGVSVAGSFLQNVNSNEYAYSSGVAIGNWSGIETYAVVRGTPNIWLKRVGGSWKIFWVQSQTVGLYPFVSVSGGTSSVNYIRALALPAPFDSDDGLATDTHSGSVAAGTTFSHEADCLIEYTVDTLATSGYMSVRFRWVDANNFWLIEIEGGVGNLRLYERVSGAYSQRGYAAGAVSSNTRIVAIADNQAISVYADNAKLFSYASAANFATATAGETGNFGTGGAISDLKTWPRTLSGTAASILNKASG